MTARLFVSAGGGLGDVIHDYFRNDSWRLLAPVKKAFPNTIITAVFLSHCSAPPELVTFHPAITSTFIYPWFCPGDPKERAWKEILSKDVQNVKDFANANKISEREDPILYLSSAEQKTVDELLEKPPIVIHPFAGLRRRSFLLDTDGKHHCITEKQCVDVCNTLASKGERVIIIGRSEILEGCRSYNEKLTGLSSDVIDMCDKLSTRQSVYLARTAKAFLGTHSSMLVAAWTGKTPSVCFYPTMEENGENNSIQRNGGHTGNFALNEPWNYAYQMNAEQFSKLTVDEIIDKINFVLSKKG